MRNENVNSKKRIDDKAGTRINRLQWNIKGDRNKIFWDAT